MAFSPAVCLEGAQAENKPDTAVKKHSAAEVHVCVSVYFGWSVWGFLLVFFSHELSHGCKQSH